MGLEQGETAVAMSVFEPWLRANFSEVVNYPLGSRHRRLWRWFEDLKTEPPRPRVEVWPRGGAKSATAELATVFAGTRLSRRFALYVCATQSQADHHVQTIAGFFERIGAQRALSRYGASRGWRRNQLQTADGFSVAAYGLDRAARGVKIDRYRPDLIVFDDIDSQADSAAVIERKIDAITRAIIPAGSSDCAVLVLQNLIHEEGIVARLADGRADFLMDREMPEPEPAVRGLVTRIIEKGDGAKAYEIVSGEATWEGQPIDVCQRQINDWGLRAFLQEAQHEIKGAGGTFFTVDQFAIVDDAPPLQDVCLAWDLAATEGGGDHTAAVLMGLAANGVVYVLQVLRGQFGSDKVRRMIVRNAELVHRRFPRYSIHLPQDPGQAGKDQALQLRRLLSAFKNVRVEQVTGSKAVRARGWADRVNVGNARLIRGPWNAAFIDEHRKFREDAKAESDDQIDAASDAFNQLTAPGVATVSRRISTNAAYQHNYLGSGCSRPWFERREEDDEEDDDD